MPLTLPADSVCLVDAATVETAYDRMAEQINACYGDRPILLVTVLNGGQVAAVHLAQRLSMPLVMDYLHVSRYRGETSGGTLHWIARPRHELAGRDVLIVDDILDEGTTLAAIVQHCVDAGAASVRAAVLVRKLHDRQTTEVVADFIGLEVEDRYVFGCGMDYQESFRHLPEIWALAD